MTVLVLGATGTVGRDVVAGLARAGVPVRAASRRPDGVPHGIRFDLTDRATWAPALVGVRALFLVRPPEVVRVADDLLPFVDAAVAGGVRRVVFLSVQGAERIRVVPHRRIERHLERSGAAWTFLRAGYFLQNLVTVHREEIRDRGEISVPAGQGRTAFVDTRDVAEVAVAALRDDSTTCAAPELTGTRASTYAEVAAQLSATLGRPIVYPAPSPVRYVREQRRRGVPFPFVALTLALYTTARLGLAAHTSPELATLLGCPPRDVAAFVADHEASWTRTAK